MRVEEVKMEVRSRYSKFAETGGNKDSCLMSITFVH